MADVGVGGSLWHFQHCFVIVMPPGVRIRHYSAGSRASHVVYFQTGHDIASIKCVIYCYEVTVPHTPALTLVCVSASSTHELKCNGFKTKVASFYFLL